MKEDKKVFHKSDSEKKNLYRNTGIINFLNLNLSTNSHENLPINIFTSKLEKKQLL